MTYTVEHIDQPHEVSVEYPDGPAGKPVERVLSEGGHYIKLRRLVGHPSKPDTQIVDWGVATGPHPSKKAAFEAASKLADNEDLEAAVAAAAKRR